MRNIVQSVGYKLALGKGPINPRYQSPQIYNNVIEFDCGKVITKINLGIPYHKIKYPDTLFLKTYKALIFKAINKNQMFLKGSTYTNFQLTLKETRQFLGCNWWNGESFVIDKGNQYFKAELDQHSYLFNKLIDNQMIVNQSKKQNPTPTQQQDNNDNDNQSAKNEEQKNIKSIKDKNNNTVNGDSTVYINIEMKNMSQQSQSHIKCQMKMSDLLALKRILDGSVTEMYGLNQLHQFNLDKLVGRFERGQIGEQDQFDSQNFVL